MAKNITVIDENGNIVGSTYPKRAEGLVRKGRARRIGDTAVVLRAEKKESEANEMAANIYEVFDNQISKMQEQLRGESAETAMPVRIQILKTMELFCERRRDEQVIELVKSRIDRMSESLASEPPTPETAAAREKTRQAMLGVLSKLLDGETKPQTGERPDAAAEQKPETEKKSE